MTGIFPDYIGPTIEYRHASRLPRWILVLGDVIPGVPPEAFYGGVIVLQNTYGVGVQAVARGFRRVESSLAVEVLSNTPGVGMVTKLAATILLATKAAVMQVSETLGFKTKPSVGAEVVDEESGVDD